MIKLYCPSNRDNIYINPNHIIYMYSISNVLTLVQLVGDIEFRVEESIEEILALINKK